MAAEGIRISPVYRALAAASVAVALLAVHVRTAPAQPLPEGLAAKQEQARSLEREISALEARMAEQKRDWFTISSRLALVQEQIVTCYLEVDAARARVERTRRKLTSLVRSLYVEGRADDLLRLLDSRDLSEFVVKYDLMIKATVREARTYRELKDNRRRLEQRQAELAAFKREAARLERAADTTATEAELAARKQELAGLTAEMISMELPTTYVPAVVSFSPSRTYSMPDENGFVRTGQSFNGYSGWYGADFHGRPTASGEIFDQHGFTCAHRTLPLGTWLRVAFRGRAVIVKINDRGPSAAGRVLDLSRGAAEAIGLGGVQWVDCEIVVPRGT